MTVKINICDLLPLPLSLQEKDCHLIRICRLCGFIDYLKKLKSLPDVTKVTYNCNYCDFTGDDIIEYFDKFNNLVLSSNKYSI